MKNFDKILFLDACSPIVQVGILHENKWIGYYKSEKQALESLFEGIEKCLKMGKMEFKDITHFAYCEGPGSLLGIRVAIMAIRAWKALKLNRNKKVYAYNSFKVSLELVRKFYNKVSPYYIVSGVRAGTWNILSAGGGEDIFEIKEEELKKLKGDKWYFKQRKLLPENNDLYLKEFDYNIEKCAESFIEKKWLREVLEPEALVVEEPEYVKWDFKRHIKENQYDIK